MFSFQFTCGYPIFPTLLAEETFFFPLYTLASFVEDWLTRGLWVYFLALYSVPLIHSLFLWHMVFKSTNIFLVFHLTSMYWIYTIWGKNMVEIKLIARGCLQEMGGRKESDMTERLNWTEPLEKFTPLCQNLSRWSRYFKNLLRRK